MIMYENYQFANWRPGCGTLKASGGDYGGGLGKLDRVSVLERRTSYRHPHSKKCRRRTTDAG